MDVSCQEMQELEEKTQKNIFNAYRNVVKRYEISVHLKHTT
jgi:hypothetical protein